MIGLGSLIGSAIGLIGTGVGIGQAEKAAEKVKQNIEDQQRANQNWYDRRYNEDATQRADAQRLLTLTQENFKKRNKAAQGAAAVAGGTEESVAAEKAANAQALADATSRIAAAGEARKDAIEEQYMATQNDLNNQLNQTELQKAQAIANATSALGSAAMNAGAGADSLLDDIWGGKPVANQKQLRMV